MWKIGRADDWHDDMRDHHACYMPKVVSLRTASHYRLNMSQCIMCGHVFHKAIMSLIELVVTLMLPTHNT